MSEVIPANDYNRTGDYALRGSIGAGAGMLAGGIANKLLGNRFLAPSGIIGGGLLGGLGGLGSAYYKDLHTNRYIGNDWHRDAVYQMEVPLGFGVIPGIHHSATFATLTPESFEKLPESEKKKWRCWDDGKTGSDHEDPIYFRATSGSAEEGRPMVADSEESDYAITKYLFEHSQPDNLMMASVRRRPRLSNGSFAYDGLGPAQISHISQIDLNDNGDIPMGVYINDAMNENVNTIMSTGKPYLVTSNNCHFNTVGSEANNSHFRPGTFRTGGWRGAEATTGEVPKTRVWSGFGVKQH